MLEGLAALRKELKCGASAGSPQLDAFARHDAGKHGPALRCQTWPTRSWTQTIIEERIQQNPALKDWFASQQGQRGHGMNQAITAIKDFGDQLGEEIPVERHE